MGASWFAHSHGCSLNEGSPSTCIVGGKDYGQTLYGLGLLFIFAFITIPVGGIIAAIAFIKKDKSNFSQNDNAVATARDPEKAKRLIWLGLAFILIPSILSMLLSLTIRTLGISIMPIYAALVVVSPIVGFAKIFCVPFGIVLLIVGIARHFSK